ncbi:MAG: hypothetical protein RI897_1090 [Verrucomicrobiota bacterium]|jgi:hypothetical protein
MEWTGFAGADVEPRGSRFAARFERCRRRNREFREQERLEREEESKRKLEAMGGFLLI